MDATDKVIPLAVIWEGYAYAFRPEMRAFAMWCYWRTTGVYRIEHTAAAADMQQVLGICDARRLVRTSLFWRRQGGQLVMKHPAQLRKRAYKRCGVYKTTRFQVPLVAYQNLTELRSFAMFPVSAHASGELTLRRYSGKAMGTHVSTVSRYRKVLYRAGWASRAPVYRKVSEPHRPRHLRDAPPARDPSWGRAAFYGSDDVWRRYCGDAVYLDTCRIVLARKARSIFESHKNYSPPHLLIPYLSALDSGGCAKGDVPRVIRKLTGSKTAEGFSKMGYAGAISPLRRREIFFGKKVSQISTLLDSISRMPRGATLLSKRDRWHRYQRTCALLGGGRKAAKRVALLYMEGGLPAIVDVLRREQHRFLLLSVKYRRRAEAERGWLRHSERCYA